MTRARGEGSIFRRSRDGMYVATTPQQQGRRKEFTAKTRRAALEKRAAYLADVDGHTRAKLGSPTLAAFLTDWLTHVRLHRAPRTYEAYRQRITAHVIPAIGRTTLAQLAAHDLQRFQDGLIAGGLAPRTVQGIMFALSAALSDAETWELIPRNVARLVRRPRPPQPRASGFEPQAARAILDAIKAHRLAALVTLTLACGLRVSEVIGLRWVDVEWDRRVLHVMGQLQRLPPGQHDGDPVVWRETKTHRGRTIALPSFLLAVLEQHRAVQATERAYAAGWGEHGLIFTTIEGQPLNRRTPLHVFQEALKRAGLPKMTLHELRHGASSLLLAAGVPPRTTMELLGHASLTQTMLTYGHVGPNQIREAAERMEGLLQGDVVAVPVSRPQA